MVGLCSAKAETGSETCLPAPSYRARHRHTAPPRWCVLHSIADSQNDSHVRIAALPARIEVEQATRLGRTELEQCLAIAKGDRSDSALHPRKSQLVPPSAL